MNRFASLLALLMVIAAVAWAVSSGLTASWWVAAVLVTAGVFAYKFALSVRTADLGFGRASGAREFLVCVARNIFRFAIGAVVITWMVLGLLWWVRG
jgi:hypothetical protein